MVYSYTPPVTLCLDSPIGVCDVSHPWLIIPAKTRQYFLGCQETIFPAIKRKR